MLARKTMEEEQIIKKAKLDKSQGTTARASQGIQQTA